VGRKRAPSSRVDQRELLFSNWTIESGRIRSGHYF
jgi:hypothetical protein